MTIDTVNRRKFLKVSTTTMATLLIGCSEKGTVKPSPTVETGPSTQDTAPSEPAPQTKPATCSATSRDITGPYWRKGIPVRTQFDVYGHPGQKLTISGVVRDRACQPIPNAVIEMWHAQPTMAAAESLSPRDSVGYDLDSPGFQYYGQFATDARGAYAVSTKKPGWYLNGAAFRPSHIHVKVYVEGAERLTTQLYFEGDPFIAADPWASVAPERALTLKSIGKDHVESRFDFTIT